MDCCVCLEEYTKDRPPIDLNCGHTLCEECMGQCRRYRLPCPQCRAPLRRPLEEEVEGGNGSDVELLQSEGHSGWLHDGVAAIATYQRPIGSTARVIYSQDRDELKVELWPSWLSTEGTDSVAGKLQAWLMDFLNGGFIQCWSLPIFIFGMVASAQACPAGNQGACFGWIVGVILTGYILCELAYGLSARQTININRQSVTVYEAPAFICPLAFARAFRLKCFRWRRPTAHVRASRGDSTLELMVLEDLGGISVVSFTKTLQEVQAFEQPWLLAVMTQYLSWQGDSEGLVGLLEEQGAQVLRSRENPVELEAGEQHIASGQEAAEGGAALDLESQTHTNTFTQTSESPRHPRQSGYATPSVNPTSSLTPMSPMEMQVAQVIVC